MLRKSWLGWLRPDHRLAPATHRRAVCRLRVEALEDRTVPSGMSLVGRWDHQDDPNHQHDHDHLNSDLWAEEITRGRFRGTYAYLGHWSPQGAGQQGVDIINISDPRNPTLASVFRGTGGDNEIVDIHVQNGIAFFASNTPDTGGIYVVDVSNPYAPRQLARIDPSNGGFHRTHTLTVSGNYLYEVHPRFAEIRVFDISNPAQPRFVRSIASPSGFGIHEATARNGRLYTADFHRAGLTAVFDISNVGDLTRPVPLLGSIISGIGTHTSWPTDDGNFVVVAHETMGLGLDIYDFSNPANPRRASNIVVPVTEAVSPHQPMVIGNLLYVAWYEAGVRVYNIADPYHPVFVADYDTYPGPSGEEGECAANPHGPFSDFDPYPVGCGAWGVYPFLGNDRILVSDFDGGLFIVSLDNPPRALTAAATPPNPIGQTLRSDQVQPLLTEALTRWNDAGVDASALHGIDIRIADLGGATLGQLVGNTIWLDDNAAGWGWFVDPTPSDDSEFFTPGNQGEQNRMDLLTVIEHEIGHLLGRDHDEEGVMAETLAAGTRPGATRGPDADLWLMEAALFGAVDVDVERPWLGNRGRVMH